MTATAKRSGPDQARPNRDPAWLTRLIIVAVLGMTLGGFLGSVYWALDLLAHPRLHYLLTGLAALVVGLVRRDRVVLLAAASVLVINALTMASLFVGGHADPAAGAEPLRVMTFNLFHVNRDTDAILEEIASSDADVVFLHELSAPVRQVIEEDLGGYRFAMEDGWGFASGSAALVREGLEVVPTTLRIGPFQRFPSVTLAYEGATVELVGVHPLSPVTPRRSRARDRALEDVALWVTERPGEVVVAGDFNASPFSHAYRTFQDISGLRSSIDGAGWQGTWPNTWKVFQLPIDHAFVSDGLTVVERRVGGHAGSDHAALILDVAPAA